MSISTPNDEGTERTAQSGDSSVSTSTRNTSTTLSVIIPTFNERENVEQVVTETIAALDGVQFEVIVVDDGSPDGTAELAAERFHDRSDVRVINREELESGLSKSVLEGFNVASGDYYAVIDADLQHPPEKLPELLQKCMGGADMAIGSRYHSDGSLGNWSQKRKLVSAGAKTISRIATPDSRRTTDPMSGFFMVDSTAIDGTTLEPKGYKILLEILDRCELTSVEEVPYSFRDREKGESNLTAGEYLNFIEHSGMMFFRRLGMNDPEKWVRMTEFMAVGGLGAIVNMAVFYLMHTLGGLFYMASATAAFGVAVTFNYIIDWAVTFDKPDGSIFKQYLAFVGTCIGGFVIQLTALTGVVEVLGASALLGNLIGIIAGFVWNFAVSDSVIFA